MSWNPAGPNPCVPLPLQAICEKYVLWPFGNICNFGCPYCFGQFVAGVPKPRDWTEAQAIAGFQDFYEDYGAAFVLMAGAEPTLEIPLVAAVLQQHYGSISTNLSCDLDVFCTAIPPDRVYLHPTFHPLGWDMEIEPFMARVRTLKARGYEVPLVALVGYPPFLPRLHEYVAAIEAEDCYANIAPARFPAVYEGRNLPQDYTEEELAILMPYVGRYSQFDEHAVVKPLRVVACAAGVATMCIMPNGHVQRCSQVAVGMEEANFMQSGHIKFLDEPLPCDQPQCQCGNLYCYHITDEVAPGEGQKR